MAIPVNELVEVHALSGIYRDWTTATVSYSHDESWIRHFRVQTTEPDPKVLRLKPGDEVTVWLAGQVAIKSGFIETRQVGYDATRHGIQVDGYSHAWSATVSSVDPQRDGVQFQNYTFEAIAKRLLKPLGLKIRMVNPPKAASEPIKNAIPHHGETVGGFLVRLAGMKGMWLSVDPDGTFVAGAGETTKDSAIVLEEGVNIISASSVIKIPIAEKVKSSGQTQGGDSVFGRRVSEALAEAKIEGGRKGTVIIDVPPEPMTAQEAEARANMTLSDINRAMITVTVTHQGFLKPDRSGLWQLKDHVTVKSPMLFPTKDGQLDLQVWGVTMTQGEGGTLTTLELCNPVVFGQKNLDATEPALGQAKEEPAKVVPPLETPPI